MENKFWLALGHKTGGEITELNYPGYRRVPQTRDDFKIEEEDMAVNMNAITFPAATEDVPNLDAPTHLLVYWGEEDSNFLLFEANLIKGVPPPNKVTTYTFHPEGVKLCIDEVIPLFDHKKYIRAVKSVIFKILGKSNG